VDADLGLALSLADLADSLSVPRFRAVDLAVETKSDLTPVTDADRAVERTLRERLASERPDDAVLGEEEGGGAGADGRLWVLDPIDGTRNFARGIPVWATLIALVHDGASAVGVVSAPALGRRWWATRGGGAFADGTPIHVSRIGSIDEAAVSGFSGFPAFAERAWHIRDFGDFWQHVLVAEGSLEVALDPMLSTWDIPAVALVVEEAGGRCTGVDGGRPTDSLVSSNGVLHEEALGALRQPHGL
jgi:histidinol-phosphatase